MASSIAKLIENKKTALVLAGGGFKGAYQIGVIKALRSLGIKRFDVICGTSVGALNAILVAQNALNTADRLWSDVKMMRLSIQAWGLYLAAQILFFIPLVVAYAWAGIALNANVENKALGFLILIVFVLLPISYFDTLKTESESYAPLFAFARRFWQRFWIPVVFVPICSLLGIFAQLYAFASVATDSPRVTELFLLFGFLFSCIAIGTVSAQNIEKTIHIGDVDFLIIFALLPPVAVILAIVNHLHQIELLLANAVGRPGSQGFQALADLLTFLWGVVAIIGGYILGREYGNGLVRLFVYAQQRAQLFSNAGILKLVDENFDLEEVKKNVSKLYVTLAEKRNFLNPFKRRISANNVSALLGKPKFDTGLPARSTLWVPNYVDIGELNSRSTALEMFRLTSALPMIFKMGHTTGGEMIVDGGIVDNIPITPALYAGADVVIVLMLDERAPAPYAVKKHINRTWRLWATAAMSEDEAISTFRQWNRHGGLRIDSIDISAEKDGVPSHKFVETDYSYYLARPFTLLGKTLILICPKRPLCIIRSGPLRFLTGTLNFSRSYRRRWLKAGYAETMQLFASQSSNWKRTNILKFEVDVAGDELKASDATNHSANTATQ